MGPDRNWMPYPRGRQGTDDLRRRRTPRLALAVGLFAALTACSSLNSPEIVAAGETTVSIRAGHLRDARPLAERHCTQYGRKAESVGQKILNYDQTVVLHVFDCVES